MRRISGVIVLAALVIGCASEPPGEEEPEWLTVVDASTVGDPIVVDLRDATHAWRFDPSDGATPLDRVLVIRPDGRYIRLDPWLVEQETATGIELGRRVSSDFSISASAELARAALQAWVPEIVCVPSSDGAHLCADATIEPLPDQTPPSGDGSGDTGSRGGSSGRSGDSSWDSAHPRSPRPPLP